MPEERVVPDLGRIVVNAAGGFFHDGLQIHLFKFCAFLQVVEIDHISVVVLAVVKLKGFLAVMRCQGIDGIWQCGQCVFHLFLLIKSRYSKEVLQNPLSASGKPRASTLLDMC